MVIKDFNVAYYGMLSRFINGQGVKELYNERVDEYTYTMLNESMTVAVSTPPVLGLRHININACKAEAEWFLSGSSNVTELEQMGCNFYRHHHALADDGTKTVGKYVGWMLRHGPHGDQVSYVIRELFNTGSRRAVINLFDTSTQSILPSCIVTLMFTRIEGALHMTINYRSADFLVGFPNDMLSMYFIGEYIARSVSAQLVTMHVNFNNVHIYESQMRHAIAIYNNATSLSPVPEDTTAVVAWYREVVDLNSQESIDKYNKNVFKLNLTPVI